MDLANELLAATTITGSVNKRHDDSPQKSDFVRDVYGVADGVLEDSVSGVLDDSLTGVLTDSLSGVLDDSLSGVLAESMKGGAELNVMHCNAVQGHFQGNPDEF